MAIVLGLAFAFWVFSAELELDIGLDLDVDAEMGDLGPALPVTSRHQGRQAIMEKLPSTGLKMLVPCVPGGSNKAARGRAFKAELRACGSIQVRLYRCI